ncbi:YveK family protein [Lactiplantibacillus plantarum]|uniref:hypothetical protein n=1 Tax=Lactiplantibacillus plantarum TaxID=1590 RepID=UPI001D05F07A|nr:hypothetical protein [Lactiplantibacillus plantarum]MCB7178154.1 hypothetical protein [Lactiplantibacillus plantarum]
MKTVLNWNLSFFSRLLKKYIVIVVLLSVIVAMAGTVGVSFLKTPTYTSQVQMSQNDNNVSQITSYSQFLETDKFTTLLKNKVNKSNWKSQAGNYIVNVSTDGNSTFFYFQATASSPKAAQYVANQVMNVFTANIGKYLSGASVTVVSKASVPTKANSINFEKTGLSIFGITFFLLFFFCFYKEVYTNKISDRKFISDVYGIDYLGELELKGKREGR